MAELTGADLALAGSASASAGSASTPALRFTDTHCHAHDPEIYHFAIERRLQQKKSFKQLSAPEQAAALAATQADYAPEKLLTRAAAAGVHRVICIGTTPPDSLQAAALASAPPAPDATRAQIFWSYGIHPDELKHADFDHATALAQLDASARDRLVAIGEVGLDYHASSRDRAAQIRLFEAMLDLAQTHNLPLIFHVREAFDDFFAVLANFSGPLRGVVHSFSDSPANLTRSLDHDFYIGVNGLATFADIPLPPLERLLLETDAPFLAPQTHRGEINEPAFIPEIAQNFAIRLGVPLTEFARQTEANATQLFRL